MGKKEAKLADIGEFGFIESIREGCLFSPSRLLMGIGDDCAVIGPYEDKVFLITTDLLIQDIHFILTKTTPFHLGRKAMAVNLSDIAAMGGIPLHAFISVAFPRTADLAMVHGLYSGIKLACQTHKVNILGGDTSASPERLFINVAIVGEAPVDEVLYRKGAMPGDGIYVTGTLGDAAGGLKMIRCEATGPPMKASFLVDAHNNPFPFLEAGRLIARSRLAGAMIDISDGLISDLGHVCRASGAGALLDHPSIPLSEELKDLGKINGFDPYELALYGGEDYRLLITVPEEHCIQFEGLFSGGTPCPIHRIGEMTTEMGIRMAMEDGRVRDINLGGFDHFH
jgi:thiamine-monophosphate kinase